MYGGSNEVFGKNENFPLVLDIKLHLKIPVNYQLQISPPPIYIVSAESVLFPICASGTVSVQIEEWGLEQAGTCEGKSGRWRNM